MTVFIRQLSRCNRLLQHSCRRSAFKASPWGSLACQKSWLTTGRCYHFLPAPQCGCSALVTPIDPEVLFFWGSVPPEPPRSMAWASLLGLLCCEDTCFINPDTTNYSPNRAGRNKMRIQESLWYHGAGHLQFSSQCKSVRHDSVSSYAKLLLIVSLLPL